MDAQLGTPQRGSPAMGNYDHSTGSGFVPARDGEYIDAIKNRKALVRLYVHEATASHLSPRLGFAP